MEAFLLGNCESKRLLFKSADASIIYSLFGMSLVSMKTDQAEPPQRPTTPTLAFLEGEFPNISRMGLNRNLTASPLMSKLRTLLEFAIPVHTFQPNILELYQSISEAYHSRLLLKPRGRHSDEAVQQTAMGEREKTVRELSKPNKCRINYVNLARFIESFSMETMGGAVSDEVIRQAEAFKQWPVKQVEVEELPSAKRQPRREKREVKGRDDRKRYQREEETIKLAERKSESGVVSIMLGKNIDLKTHKMRAEMIERARNNKFLDEASATLDKVDSEITYILNRITEEYFGEFVEELRPYARHECHSVVLCHRIIEKVGEEHSYIRLYSKLVGELRKVKTGETGLTFRTVFVERLQALFYEWVRNGEWEGREEQYKKQLLGVSLFVGELVHWGVVTRKIFPDCFYELASAYVRQYRQFQHLSNFYCHQTYIECITKMIQKMGKQYDKLLEKTNHSTVQSVLEQILAQNNQVDHEFHRVCDYAAVLKALNNKLPSQRHKITFLLQDLRCERVMRREEQLDNSEFDVVKEILAIDQSQAQDVARIPTMVSRCEPESLMKDFYFQFAEGNLKQVNKHLEAGRLMLECKGVNEACLSAFQNNLEGLYLIESDFPFLAEGVARMVKAACDSLGREWRELELHHPDEDVQEFIDKVEGKFFKMLVED